MDKKIKWLVFDLDGTLLRNDKTLSPRTLAALDRCREQGLGIAIATARSETAAGRVIRAVQPDAVLSNGGGRVRVEETTVYAQTLPAKRSDALLRDLTALPGYAEVTVETEKAYYVSYQNESTQDYAHSKYHDFSRPLGQEAYKITVHLTEETGLAELVRQYPECGLTPFAGEPWYRFAHKNATKMEGIRHLAAYFGLELDAFAAFGDDYNDVEMLRACGLGIAMGNAVTEAKNAADLVIGTNEEDGIAEYVERFICN